MKHSNLFPLPSSLLSLTSYLLILTSSAAVDQRWTCETSRVEPVYFNAYHGETLKLDAKLLSNGRPVTNVTTASFLWQTNGMGSAWWQTNATIVAGHVKATFTPAMDPGASAVTFFFQVTDQDGSNYRPSGKLYLVKALGDNPTFPDIPPPGGTIDFSRLTLVNAPWATLEAAQSAVATGVNQALSAVANESNRAERTYAKLSDIPAVPSIAGLATTGQVAAAAAEAQAAAESTAAATYQPLAGMADYAKLTDIPAVPSIAGLATTGQVAAAKAEAQAAAESTAASTYQPLAGMADYARLSDIPAVPSIDGLATTGEVAAAKAEAQAAAESTAAATYQPLAGMADYAKLTDIPAVPSIAGLATTGEVAAAAAEAQAAAEATAAATYQPLSAMVDYAQKHEVPVIGLTNRTLTVDGNSVTIPYPGEAGSTISDGANAIDAAGNVYTNNVLVDRLARVSQLGSGVDEKRDKADLTIWVRSNTFSYSNTNQTWGIWEDREYPYGGVAYTLYGNDYEALDTIVFPTIQNVIHFDLVTATRELVPDGDKTLVDSSQLTNNIPPAISNSTTRIDADLTVTEREHLSTWTVSYEGPYWDESYDPGMYPVYLESGHEQAYDGAGWYFSFPGGLIEGPSELNFTDRNALVLTRSTSFSWGTVTAARNLVPELTTKLATTNDLATAISTNNSAFVSAVRSTPPDPETPWGTYGTLGAAIAGIIAMLANKLTKGLDTQGVPTDPNVRDLFSESNTSGHLSNALLEGAIDLVAKTNAVAVSTASVTLNDGDTANVTLGATDALDITFAAHPKGGLRLCELYITNATADTDITFDASTVHLVNADGSFPACEAGINHFVFAEVASGWWRVEHSALTSISPVPTATV